MSAEWGDLKEPTAYVPSGESDPSPVDQRAARAGAWGESLGQYGAETWNLPGMGAAGPRCGEWYPAAVCTEAGHVDWTTHTCGRRCCPDCWGVWGKEAAVRATVRLQAWRQQQPDDYRRQVGHAILSPPDGEIMTERGYWEGRKRAAEWAERKGFKGFAVIPHGFRVTEEGMDRFRAEDPDYGRWVWLRNDVEEWRELTYWSPHYHVVGATSEDMDPAADGDEWVYHFRRSVEAYEGIRDEEAHEDLYGLFRYLLSHATFPEESTKQVTTWYGTLANSVFVSEATEEWQYQKPSEGVLSALEREVSEVAGVVVEEDDDGAGDPSSDDLGECPVDGCDGLLIDVFDVPAYLDYNETPGEVADRMTTARELRLGRVKPPPGLKRPQTEADAREGLEHLLPADSTGPDV